MDQLESINEGLDPHNTIADTTSRLEADKLFKQHRRDTRKYGAINWCFIVFVWVCLISVGAVILIRILHMVLPSTWCWLTKEQLSNMSDFFFDGGIGGIVVGFLKSSIIDKDKSTNQNQLR